jgi:hypothetical protein
MAAVTILERTYFLQLLRRVKKVNSEVVIELVGSCIAELKEVNVRSFRSFFIQIILKLWSTPPPYS